MVIWLRTCRYSLKLVFKIVKLKSLKHAPTFALKIQQIICFKILFLIQPRFFDLTPFRLLEKSWRDILKLKKICKRERDNKYVFLRLSWSFENTTSELREGMHIHVMANYQVHLSMYELRKLDISFKSLLSLSIHQLIFKPFSKIFTKHFLQRFYREKKRKS